jgi:L-ascorbate metabolism protein UlaG (beta-lactamase superfamily)
VAASEPVPCPTRTSVTWWGHATSTVEDRGVRVLLDPVLTSRLAHLSRRGGDVPGPDALVADLVAVSHLHADHLHLASLRRLPSGTRVAVPLGGRPLLDRLPLDVIEVVAGDEVEVGPGLRVRVVPAVHDDRRLPGSGLRAAPVGFVVEGAGRTYFPGDTELFVGLPDAVGAVDAALVPVGGWGPTLGAGHMGPEDGARLVEWLRPRIAVPVHWGTFWPTGLRGFREGLFASPGSAFAAAVARRGEGTEVRVLAHGTTISVA